MKKVNKLVQFLCKRLVKSYPAGIGYKDLRMQTPKGLRPHFAHAVRLLQARGIITQRKKKFHLAKGQVK